MQHQPSESPSTPFVVSLGALMDDEKRFEHAVIERFSDHPALRQAVPGDAVTCSWVLVAPDGTWTLEDRNRKSLLIILDGQGKLQTDAERLIERGDVVTLPEEGRVEVSDTMGKGLCALQVFFDEARATQSEAASQLRARNLSQLLEKNERLAAQVLSNPYFRMIQEGGLDAEAKRGHFRDRLRVFCDAFQTFLFARQATCEDETYRGIFAEHLLEELGHNDLMKVTGEKRRFDAVLEATSNWFVHQMYVQDNVGKAAVHLVLETGGDYFHNLAKPAFDDDVSSEYFRKHAEDDERHKQVSIDLLSEQTASTYERLDQVVVDSWNMIDAMTNRIHKLVHLEATAS